MKRTVIRYKTRARWPTRTRADRRSVAELKNRRPDCFRISFGRSGLDTTAFIHLVEKNTPSHATAAARFRNLTAVHKAFQGAGIREQAAPSCRCSRSFTPSRQVSACWRVLRKPAIKKTTGIVRTEQKNMGPKFYIIFLFPDRSALLACSPRERLGTEDALALLALCFLEIKNTQAYWGQEQNGHGNLSPNEKRNLRRHRGGSPWARRLGIRRGRWWPRGPQVTLCRCARSRSVSRPKSRNGLLRVR